MRERITFTAAFGDQDKTVELSAIHGTAGTLYHMYVDRFLWAELRLNLRTDEWVLHIHNDEVNNMLSYEDRAQLIALVKEDYLRKQ